MNETLLQLILMAAILVVGFLIVWKRSRDKTRRHAVSLAFLVLIVLVVIYAFFVMTHQPWTLLVVFLPVVVLAPALVFYYMVKKSGTTEPSQEPNGKNATAPKKAKDLGERVPKVTSEPKARVSQKAAVEPPKVTVESAATTSHSVPRPIDLGEAKPSPALMGLATHKRTAESEAAEGGSTGEQEVPTVGGATDSAMAKSAAGAENVPKVVSVTAVQNAQAVKKAAQQKAERKAAAQDAEVREAVEQWVADMKAQTVQQPAQTDRRPEQKTAASKAESQPAPTPAAASAVEKPSGKRAASKRAGRNSQVDYWRKAAAASNSSQAAQIDHASGALKQTPASAAPASGAPAANAVVDNKKASGTAQKAQKIVSDTTPVSDAVMAIADKPVKPTAAEPVSATAATQQTAAAASPAATKMSATPAAAASTAVQAPAKPPTASVPTTAPAAVAAAATKAAVMPASAAVSPAKPAAVAPATVAAAPATPAPATPAPAAIDERSRFDICMDKAAALREKGLNAAAAALFDSATKMTEDEAAARRAAFSALTCYLKAGDAAKAHEVVQQLQAKADKMSSAERIKLNAVLSKM